MPRPSKTPLERVREGSFRPDRHAELLLEEQLPRLAPSGVDEGSWHRLRELQIEFRQARSRRERSSVAYAFAELAREANRPPELTFGDQLVASCGPSALDGRGVELEDAWVGMRSTGSAGGSRTTVRANSTGSSSTGCSPAAPSSGFL